MKPELPFLLLLLCAPGLAGDAPEGETPLQQASSALDLLRDETHKKEMKIVWPETGSIDAPADCDVLLILGYINYTCIRIHREDGGPVVGERVKMNRTWFYNPTGESYEALRSEIDPGEFAQVWAAARLLLGARAEPVNPPEKPDNAPEFEDGVEVIVKGRGHGMRRMRSSHAAYEWVGLRSARDGSRTYQQCVRGWRWRDGIQDFEELRVRALRKLFEPLASAPAQATPFPMSDWNAFLEGELQARLGQVTMQGLDDTTRVFLECALRILGETGGASAETLIGRITEPLAGADEEKNYWAANLRSEGEMALTKIRFRLRWDADEALRQIHANPRTRHAQNDLAEWIRDQYFKHDKDDYRRALISDLRANDSALCSESIGELARRYPGHGLPEIRALLASPDPEIVVQAAFALLDYEPDHADALTRLDRIASDPAVCIPGGAHWFNKFARNLAMERLCAEKTPATHRWDSQRVRAQLAKPGEDGRMVIQLISQAAILKNPLTEREQIAVLLAALDAPPTRGWLDAAEKLIELKDRSSIAIIRERIKTLAADCNRELSWRPDTVALYPWTDQYDLERIGKAADALEKATADETTDRRR